MAPVKTQNPDVEERGEEGASAALGVPVRPLTRCSDLALLPHRYCTDDMLQREMMSSPFLSSHGVVVLDDVHERSVATDVLLALLKDVLPARPELKLVINASPLLVSRLSSYYGGVPVVEVPGGHPVEVVHLGGAQRQALGAVLRLIFEIHRSGEKGDVVVFLACEQVSDVPTQQEQGYFLETFSPCRGASHD